MTRLLEHEMAHVDVEGTPKLKPCWRWLGAVLAVGAVLRLFGIRWGFPYHFHPDENMMIIVLDRIRAGHLNPDFFAYGSFPLYLVKGIIGLFTVLIQGEVDPYLVGRIVAALCGIATLLVLFILGRRVYGDRAALFGTLFLALSVIHIQLSHFYTVDIFLALIVVATLLGAWRLGSEGDRFSYIATGLLLGLGGATKGAAVFLLPPIALAHWFGPGNRNRGRWSHVALLAGAAALAFMLAEPYAVLDLGHFLRDLAEQSSMVTGRADFPYTRQYAGTIPYLYQVRNTLLWGLGLPLEILALLGLALAVKRAVGLGLFRGGRRGFRLTLRPTLAGRNWSDLFVLSFVIPYFLVVGAFHTKHMRYLAPIVPLLCLVAGRLIVYAIERLRTAGWRRFAVGAAWCAFALTALYALAFARIYLLPSTRLAATEWIGRNAGSRDTILIEHWDDRVPVDADDRGYNIVDLPQYEPDTEEKRRLLADALAGGDWIVLASNRLYGSIIRNEDRYPVTSDYYRLLFRGRLGYRLARTFVSYPGLFGITLRDDLADESFTVYDHPKVIVFERTESLPAEELLRRLEHPREDARSISLREMHRLSLAGLPSPAPDPASLSILGWWLMVTALGLAAAPFGIVVFRNLGDGGVAFWRPLGILATSVLVWLWASLGLVSFGRGSAIASGLLLAVIGWGIITRRRDLLVRTAGRWRRMLEAEAVFLAAFLGFLLVRANNPNIHDPVGHGYCGGGEAMDFAFLNALTRANSFPPYDPWLAGYSINYYYFGHAISAVLTRLSGLRTAVSFNLLIALFGALTVAGVFSIAYNMTGRSWAGIFAGASVGILGNLDGALQVLGNLKKVLTEPLWQDALSRLMRSGVGMFPFDFWRSSRVIPNTVNEFPYFSFLFADLHAHMMVIPFTVLVVGLALAVISSGERGWGFGRGMEGVVGFIFSALAVGALLAINPWNYPTGILLLGSVILLGKGTGGEHPDTGGGHPSTGGGHTDTEGEHPGTTVGRWKSVWGWLRSLLKVRLSLLALAIASIALFLPFHLSFVPRSRAIAVVAYHTELKYFIIIFGLFAYVIGTYTLVAWSRTSSRPRRFIALAVALVVGLAVFLWVRHWGAAFVAGSIVLVWWILFRSPRSEAPDRYGLILIGIGLLLVFFPEILHVVDFNGRGELARFNTVFKLHLQAWILFGIGSAWALHRLRIYAYTLPSWGRRWWPVPFWVLVLCAAIYPVAGTLAKCSLASGFRRPTLDGIAYMERSNPGDHGAIRWLETRARGSPLVLEATGEGYNTWYSRISIFTGLPTVLGWGWHEFQWRYSDELIQRRERLITELYTVADDARAGALIEDLGIDYVVVGELERSRYGLEGLDKFPRLMDLVYAGNGTSLFRRRGLSGTAAARPADQQTASVQFDAAAQNMFVGGRGKAPGEFVEPRGAAPDREGGVYVVDFGNARVQHFDHAGRFLLAWGRSGDRWGEFDDPCGITVDREGYIYVADTWNGRVQKFDPVGNCLAVWTDEELGLYGPRGLAVGGDGFLYVADTGNHRIVVFDRQGEVKARWGKRGEARGEFTHPTDVAIDRLGRVLVADAGNSRVQIFTPDGRTVGAWGVRGWGEGTYSEPCILTESEMAGAAVPGFPSERPEERGGTPDLEHVYLTDPVNHRVLCYTASGTEIGSLGVEGGGSLQFRFPIGIAPDGAGKLFVVDCLNHRVQRLDPVRVRDQRVQALERTRFGDDGVERLDPLPLGYDSIERFDPVPFRQDSVEQSHPARLGDDHVLTSDRPALRDGDVERPQSAQLGEDD